MLIASLHLPVTGSINKFNEDINTVPGLRKLFLLFMWFLNVFFVKFLLLSSSVKFCINLSPSTSNHSKMFSNEVEVSQANLITVSYSSGSKPSKSRGTSLSNKSFLQQFMRVFPLSSFHALAQLKITNLMLHALIFAEVLHHLVSSS